MSHQALKEQIKRLSEESEHLGTAGEKVKALSAAIEVANEIIKILDPNVSELKNGEDALEEIISTNTFRNQKIEDWFSFHPIYPDERLALRFFESDICEIKFYWLNDNSTKARISAGVMLTPNWEDRETTENDEYKVGIDFFLKKDAKSLLMVISDRGNLRVMEFTDRLTHTQEEILDKIAGSLSLSSRKAFHTILWDSMALSEVNKKFYDGIAHEFTILYQHLVDAGRDKEDAKLFSSRLLGRLLFIWFLRKKKVLLNEDYYFPADIEDSTEYYNSILKPLFFETLNTPIYARKNGDTKTPYLNGGLFDAHENDWLFEKTTFPKSYFEDLYSHLDKYNFTTDESSPDYEQVAIDPEMLGRVFESLLAEQRTDTGEQARKAKGAFYTPREIVSYMCKESLRQYLYKELGDEKYYSGIDKLLDSPDYEWETAHSNAKRDLWPFENMTKFIPKVIGILDSLTVLDPACGSGAFPMGMLQLLTKVYERLDSRFEPYRTKLNIIQNTIFGVDVEPMAVEISRLRAWLAIIVDDKGEIDPLPNLDFKFVCADSLVPLDDSVGLWDNANLHSELAEVREKYFNARKPESKDEWKKKYYRLTSSANMFSGRRELQLTSFDPFRNQKPALFFDPGYMFGVDKFDILIGNPPYVHLEKMKDIARDKYMPLKFKTYEARGDLYGLFFERGINLLKDNGILTFITSNKWMRAGYGESLRNYFVSNTQPVLLIDLGGGVFESATVDTDILILKKTDYTKETKAVSTNNNLNSSNLESYVLEHSENIKFSLNESWVILSEIERNIKNKIERFGTPLKDWDIKISRGILTGLNEAFIIDNEKRMSILNNCKDEAERLRTEQIIRPILRGRDIKRDGYEWARLYCICTFPAAHIDIEQYPAIKTYFIDAEWSDEIPHGYGELKLEQTGLSHQIGNFKFKSRKKTNNKWFETQDQIAYMDDFSKQKIIFPAIMSQDAFFSLDNDEYMIIAPGNILTGNIDLEKMLLYLITVGYWALKKFYMGGGIEGELKVNRLEMLPIPNKINLVECLQDIYDLFGFTSEEINLISSSEKL